MPIQRVLLVVLLALSRANGQDQIKSYRADLDALLQAIEKPPSLKRIFRQKGIDFTKVKIRARKELKSLAREARKRSFKTERLPGEFFGILHRLVGQLRDTHARVQVDRAIAKRYFEGIDRPRDAGCQLMPGAHGTILLADTRAGRRARNPLSGRGLKTGAILVSINGQAARKALEKRAERLYLEEGYLSTRHRAFFEALARLSVPKSGVLELVFRNLQVPDTLARRYAAAKPSLRSAMWKRIVSSGKLKKVKLRGRDCATARNPRSFRFPSLAIANLKRSAAKAVFYTTLENGYGYIVYRAVSRDSLAGLKEACVALRDCRGMILDMRINKGGGESGVSVFDRTGGVWDKPLAVLISPMAISAAETELWKLVQMRKAKRCRLRLFGSTSAGASGAKINFDLPSGFGSVRFVYRHWHGGRSKIEGIGIPPDEEIAQDPIDLSIGVDSQIAAASRWLGTQTGSKR